MGRQRPTRGRTPSAPKAAQLTDPSVPPLAPDLQPPVPAPNQQRPQDMGDRQEAFLVSGGFILFFQVIDEEFTFDPAPQGWQLLCSYYVPRGRCAWVKQVRVAPFMPSSLAFEADKITASGDLAWPTFNGSTPQGIPPTSSTEPQRPDGRNGVWTTPFAWEGYFPANQGGVFPPSWRWHLRLTPGNALLKRQQQPLFNPLDPLTWQWIPDLPVPLAAYPNGLPGAPAAFYPPQRMQVLQADELTNHVFVPEDTTVALFTEWHQQKFTPAFTTFQGQEVTTQYGPPVYPLLPSFGQLSGYQQTGRGSARRNATRGWQG